MILALLATLLLTGGPRTYRAWLETPGGRLGFGLELEPAADGTWNAFLVNGPERIPVPRVEFDGTELVLDMPHYDSRIRAHASAAEPSRLVGTWEKRRGKESVAHMPFGATPRTAAAPVTPAPGGAARVAGRWAVSFEDEAELAVALFEAGAAPGQLGGTFLTATGDYRYLDGTVTSDGLELACFDGAHAFLFRAQLGAEGALDGDFWSGDWHHARWSAVRDAQAELGDAFAQTRWNGTTRLADLVFPDLDGTPRPLGPLKGRATLLVVFGSWCPNCNDEARLLAELDARYRARGLVILGLAFELTGERERDAGQVRLFAARHGLEIPYFLCGTADKAEATRALGLVDRVRAFPTTVFVGADGLPKAVHSGFAGPATGAEHETLRADFQARIEALLAAAPAERR